MTFSDLFSYISDVAQAAPNMSDVQTIIPAPGLSFNWNIGQILQVVTIMLPVYSMWQKSQQRHALLMHSLAEMRRDVDDLKQQQRANDNFMRQMPSIISGMRRGFHIAPRVVGQDHGEANPFDEMMRQELGDEIGSENVSRVLEAMRKVMGRE